jgi:hypothetical protein
MRIRLPKSEEEKVAEKIANLITDLRIDLEQVGIYIGRMRPNSVYRRLQVIAESAEYEKEQKEIPE